MKLAQQEIKATMTVNTSDLGSKKKDEEPTDKDAPARKKGQGSGKTRELIIFLRGSVGYLSYVVVFSAHLQWVVLG